MAIQDIKAEQVKRKRNGEQVDPNEQKGIVLGGVKPAPAKPVGPVKRVSKRVLKGKSAAKSPSNANVNVGAGAGLSIGAKNDKAAPIVSSANSAADSMTKSGSGVLETIRSKGGAMLDSLKDSAGTALNPGAYASARAAESITDSASLENAQKKYVDAKKELDGIQRRPITARVERVLSKKLTPEKTQFQTFEKKSKLVPTDDSMKIKKLPSESKGSDKGFQIKSSRETINRGTENGYKKL